MTMPGSASVVVIGGGIQGLSLAFNLAARGQRGVVVLDAGYFEGGASGRNGTMIRGGFASAEWTALFALANRRWSELSRRLRHNVMFSRRGYLLVAESPRTAAPFADMLALHRAHGVISRRVRAADLVRLEPALDTRRVAEALFLADGGVAPHHAAMHGYRAACLRHGVTVCYETPVRAIERQGGLACLVVGDGFSIRTDAVVNAAGAYAPAVAELAGLALPGAPMRIEAMALEPTRPILRRGLALLDRLCYVSQTARGELVGGAEVAERPRASLTSDVSTLAATARAYHDLLPYTRSLRILRHWAGLLHATPDWAPLIGPHPDCANLWITAGWAYGFASAPAVGELLAETMLTGRLDPRLAPFAVDRFVHGRAVREGGIVLAPAGSSG